MGKSEIFAIILDIVANTTEISKQQILSKDRYQDVVDARYMLVFFCHKAGIYNADIASMIGNSRRSVEKMITLFEQRRKFSYPIFDIHYEIIAKKVRSAFEQTTNWART